jgi:hypothetical protein
MPVSGKLLADRLRRRETLGGVRRRHPNVDDHELRFVLTDEIEKLRRIARLTDDLEIRPLEHARQALSEKDVVVGHNDPTAVVWERIDDRSTLRPSAGVD